MHNIIFKYDTDFPMVCIFTILDNFIRHTNKYMQFAMGSKNLSPGNIVLWSCSSFNFSAAFIQHTY